MAKEEKKEEVAIQRVEASAIAVAEIESQIATAKRYPRDIAVFKDELMSLATLDQETAEGCFYSVPRAGGTITGPSIRFAEIALSCYGNSIAEANVIEDDGTFIYAMGQCRDLERNVAIRMTVRRKITNKYGNRYTDDMISTTANAACAIALRNAILKIVPAAFIKAAFDKVRATAAGDAQSLSNRRAEVLVRLQKMGVEEERVLQAMKCRSVDDITTKQVAVLIGMGTAIHDGEASLDDTFPPVIKPGDVSGTASLKDKLNKPKTTPAKKVDKPEPKKPQEAAEEPKSENEGDNTEDAMNLDVYECLGCKRKNVELTEAGLCSKCLSDKVVKVK